MGVNPIHDEVFSVLQVVGFWRGGCAFSLKPEFLINLLITFKPEGIQLLHAVLNKQLAGRVINFC
jgi:hypothetical protein